MKRRNKAYPKGKRAKKKIELVMHEFKEKSLHSASKKGPIVKNPRQAVAIALSSARKLTKKGQKKKSLSK